MEFAEKTPVCNAQLSIGGLPSSLVFLFGNIYLISEEDERLADTLVWRTAIDAVAAGLSVSLVSASAVTRSLAHSGHADAIEELLAGKRLSVFELGSAGQHDVQRVLTDIDHCSVGREQLLIVDGAETIASSQGRGVVQCWRTWAQQNQSVVLLMFRNAGVHGQEPFAQLLPQSHLLAGMARIKSTYGTTSWEIFHWFDQGGLIGKSAYPLHRTSDNRLEVASSAQSPASVEPAADDRQVIAQRSVFQPREQIAATWQVIDGGPDDMLKAASASVSATLVLSYTPQTDFYAMVRSIFEIRKRCGARLKIVIREVNSRLRYSQETFAARVGANLIVPAEISYSRFLSLTSMVQGQVFSHPLPASFERAMQEATPDQEQGYLPPAEFARVVRTTLERSRLLHVQNVLLRLPLAYGLLPLDALRYCNIKRAGDICSSDDASVYLFLYACRESDVDKTIAQLFGLPVGELFTKEDRVFSDRAIQDAVMELDSRHRLAHYPDHSAELAGPPAVKAAEAPAPVSGTERKGPVVERFAAPLPAVRRPLPVTRTPTLTDVSAIAS